MAIAVVPATPRLLPPEIILQIIQHIETSSEELRKISLTSTAFRTACQSRLFRSVATRSSIEKFTEQCRSLTLPHISCHIRHIRVNITSTLPGDKVKSGQEDSEVVDFKLQNSWENRFVVELSRLVSLCRNTLEAFTLASDMKPGGYDTMPDGRTRWVGPSYYHEDIHRMLGRSIARVMGRVELPRLETLDVDQTKETFFSQVADLAALWDHDIDLEARAADAGPDFAYDILARYRKRPYFDQKEDMSLIQVKTSGIETLPAFSRDILKRNLARIVDCHADLRSDDSAQILKLFSDLTPAPPLPSSSMSGIPWWMDRPEKPVEQGKQYSHTCRLKSLRIHLTFRYWFEVRYISFFRLGNLENLRVFSLWNLCTTDASLSSALRTCSRLEEINLFCVRLRSSMDAASMMPDTWGTIFEVCKGIKTLRSIRLSRLKYIHSNRTCDRNRTLCPMFQRDVDLMDAMVEQINKQRKEAGDEGTLEEWRVKKGFVGDWGTFDIKESDCYCEDHMRSIST